jgi:hypothetical protein
MGHTERVTLVGKFQGEIRLGRIERRSVDNIKVGPT